MQNMQKGHIRTGNPAKTQLFAAMVAALATAGLASTAHAQAGAVCNISSKDFATWFVAGQPAKSGAVTFANSVGFPTNNTVCDFYKWSHQMFLWITSPQGQSIVLDSPAFYDVNFDSSGNAIYMPNTVGAGVTKKVRSFALRGTKPQNFQPGGQAGGGDTLLSLNGSLVYFGIHANDVYAWFNTAVSNGALPASLSFPSSQAELNNIVAYAKQNAATLNDANALTLELKTAWVDAATLKNPQSYITTSANVPNYIGKIGDTTWTISTTQPTITKTLALVGMHIVGTVQGHPEMVWATFEHRNNAPDDTYYASFGASTAIQKVPYNSAGSWTFMTPGGAKAGALNAMMTVNSAGNIVATTGNTIKANNVYRAMPWGNLPTAASANNNGQLITLNRTIRNTLNNLGDVRGNYFQVGAVWTQNGSIPNSPTDTAKQIGSKRLANSTMETYHQKDKLGCFACHFVSTATPPTAGTAVSHLFAVSNNPLVPKTKVASSNP
jgi:hypothetical protein